MNEEANVIITIFADTTAAEPYKKEHGFSVFVQVRKPDSAHFVLFDTGMGFLFENAPLAGIDLSRPL